MMEYFIDRGADIETDRPLAYALCNRIRTALRVFKQYRDRFPSFPEQANIALRHHCKKGNLKWISLMLWAGADPYAPGADDYDERADPECPGMSALGMAALYEHFEVFDLKQVRLNVNHPGIYEVARWACRGGNKGMEILKKLLDQKLKVNDHANGGSSIVDHLLASIGWLFHPFQEQPLGRERDR